MKSDGEPQPGDFVRDQLTGRAFLAKMDLDLIICETCQAPFVIPTPPEHVQAFSWDTTYGAGPTLTPHTRSCVAL